MGNDSFDQTAPGRRQLAIVVALAMLGSAIASDTCAQFFHSSAPPGAESVLLRLRIRESVGGLSQSPCAEDLRAGTDTLYLRVHAGDAFMVGEYGGPCRVATLDARGEVKIELPDYLEGPFVEAPPGEPRSLRVRRMPVAVSTSNVDDAGTTVEFSVVDSLPTGAKEGMRALRDPWAAHEAQKPTIVEAGPAVVPKSYRGPWGNVRVLVTLDDDGSVSEVAVEHGVSRVLDSIARTTARHYKYRLGMPCRGQQALRSMSVDFPFKNWR